LIVPKPNVTEKRQNGPNANTIAAHTLNPRAKP
jgi:hypothetical protein